ncbi:MAG: TAT-variant-translocated molybdopterin oxidoreductase [Phycisphaerales bacterium]
MHDGCSNGHEPTSQQNDAAPTTGGPARRSAYWRSVEQLADTPEYREFLHREFQPGASELVGDDRRNFIKIMGASFALAGLAAAGCRRWPEAKIAPYASRPANRTPGVPVTYATSYELGGLGFGVLATCFDGRPIKLDGNPAHPSAPLAGGAGAVDPAELARRGAPVVGPSSAVTQARILELYDPERSRATVKSGAPSKFEEFSKWIDGARAEWKQDGGAGLVVLAEPTSSPTLLDMRARLKQAYPKMTWASWCAVNDDAARAGTAAAFGSARRMMPRFDKAKVILSLDCDFLHEDPNAVANARAWAAGRSLVERKDGKLVAKEPGSVSMSRVYQVEGLVTITGMSADQRIAMRPSEVAPFAAYVADRLGVDGARQMAAFAPKLGAHDQEIADKLCEDLKAAGTSALVVAGPRQPAATHALAAAMNAALGAMGNTVHSVAAEGETCGAQIAAVVAALNAGSVKALVILGGNPVYDAPADLRFADAMAKAAAVVHLSYHRNETSLDKACTWHVPAAHFLESWGDTRGADGTVALQQPMIAPLIDPADGGRTAAELCAELLGDEKRGGYDLVRRAHMAATGKGGADFENWWRTSLDAGVCAGTAQPMQPTPAPQLAAKAMADWIAARGQSEGTELAYFCDGKMHDGRFANIGWLQELPDVVTKITWDNALLMSPATAAQAGVANGDMVEVSVPGAPAGLKAAAWILPGMADGVLGIALGYGRGAAAGTIGADSGFNAFAVRTSAAPWIAAGARVAKSAGTYAFAHTQDHGVTEAVMPEVVRDSVQERLPQLIRDASLAHYKEHPDFARHVGHVAHRLSLWEETNLDGARYRWAMTIDLASCTGCSACVVACQAENNIPIVGKDQVARGREMHWIRIDRYFKGGDAQKPDAYRVQPVTCVQCENAPCEQVCPVAATVHDKDGLNNMVYNRCIGTRYCSNNCPYKVRRFNFFDFNRRDPVRQGGILMTKPEYYVKDGPNEWLRMQFNPDVTVRMRGVMEKCSFCTQRIQHAKIGSKNRWVRAGGASSGAETWSIADGTVQTACQQACPTGAIAFGDLNVEGSDVLALQRNGRSYDLLEELNTRPRLKYLARVDNPAVDHGAHDHGHDHSGHGHDAHSAAPAAAQAKGAKA